MHFIKSLSPFKPTKFTGCALWLAADRGITTVDGKVSAWADQSGNGRHATQSTSANYRPLYVASAQGSKPTLRFDGSDDYLSLPVLTAGTSTFSMFAVSRLTGGTGGRNVMAVANWAITNKFYAFAYQYSPQSGTKFISAWGSASGASLTQQDYAYDISNIFCSVYDGTTNIMHMNGKKGSTGNYSSSDLSTSTWFIGNNYFSQFFAGDISEIIIFNRALTDAERVKIEQYLSGRYAIALA